METIPEQVRAANRASFRSILDREDNASVIKEVKDYLAALELVAETGDLGVPDPTNQWLRVEGRPGFLSYCQLIERNIRTELINAALRNVGA